MNGRIARKLRKLSNFNPKDKRHYQQFENSNNYVMSPNGDFKRGPGTIIEVTSTGDATTARARYRFMKRKLHDRTI